MTQVLHMLNGTTLNAKLQAPDNRIDRWIHNSASPEAIVKELYLSALSRYPSATEEAKLVAVLGTNVEPSEKRALVEDLVWSVLSSREFLFNH